MKEETVKLLKTITSTDPKLFDHEVNEYIKMGWKVQRLFEIPETETRKFTFACQMTGLVKKD